MKDGRFRSRSRFRWLRAGCDRVVCKCAHDQRIGSAAELFSSSDDHVEGDLPTARCGRRTARQPGASSGITSMQLQAPAALLAGVDRAWAKREALAHACGPHAGTLDANHQASSSVYPGGRHLPAEQRAGGECGRQIPGASRKTFDSGLLTQPASELVGSHFDDAQS